MDPLDSMVEQVLEQLRKWMDGLRTSCITPKVREPVFCCRMGPERFRVKRTERPRDLAGAGRRVSLMHGTQSRLLGSVTGARAGYILIELEVSEFRFIHKSAQHYPLVSALCIWIIGCVNLFNSETNFLQIQQCRLLQVKNACVQAPEQTPVLLTISIN